MKFLYFFFFIPLFSLFCAEGLEYRTAEVGQAYAHIIEVDPLLYEIKPVRALDNGIGRESVHSLSMRHGAVAAINGGFFSVGGTFDGKACGALKIHEWYALPLKPRGCLGWSPENQLPLMDRLWVKLTAHYRRENFPLDGLNRPRKKGEAILFSPCFHRTTLTSPDGQELIIVDGIVQTIYQSGSSKIPENGYVLSIQQSHPLFNTLKKGDKCTFSTQVIPLTDPSSSNTWQSLDYIVGGTPLLLYRGNKIRDFIPEQTLSTFLTNRHARTAVGVLPQWTLAICHCR